MSLFIRFVSLEGNISFILNLVCINLHIAYHKVIFFLWILCYALSNDVNKFCKVKSSKLVVLRDRVLKEIIPPENYKLYSSRNNSK